MERKTIVFVLPSLDAGGAERVMLTLLTMIDRVKFDPVIISVRGDGPLKSLIQPGENYIALDHMGKLPLCFLKLLRALKEIRPDIVFSTIAPMNFITLATRIFMPRTRYIVREATMPSYYLKKYGLMAAIPYYLLYDLADRIICPAQSMVDDFTRSLSMEREQFRILPNPVNTGMISSRSHPPERGEADLEFIAVGRLVPEKGYDRLIPALKNFQPLSGSWHLTVCGDGPDRLLLERLIEENGLKDKITLKGYDPNPWRLIAGADFFLLPSRWEGLPNVVLESLACGTPVIAMMEAGGIKEIAAQAQKEDIFLVRTIEDMVTAMGRCIPQQGNTRSDRLPDVYRPDSVQKELSEILDLLGRK